MNTIMDFNFSSSTSLYFYSALLQGNASLVALVAVFLVYRKQYLDSLFDKLEKMISDYLKGVVGVSLLYKNIFEFESYSEAHHKDKDPETKSIIKRIMEDSAWAIRFQELRSLEAKEKELWKNAKLPITSIFVILMTSVFLLPLSDFVHKCIWVEGGLFFVFVISEIVALIVLFKFIRGQLRV